MSVYLLFLRSHELLLYHIQESCDNTDRELEEFQQGQLVRGLLFVMPFSRSACVHLVQLVHCHGGNAVRHGVRKRISIMRSLSRS